MRYLTKKQQRTAQLVHDLFRPLFVFNMAGELSSNFGIHVPMLIPVQVIATDARGSDHLIGDFEGGVVLKGLDLQDVKSSTIIASFSIRSRQWVVRGKPYLYLFIQVKPRD